MCTREIVSLQLGHYSNFIGTHWWNLQETAFNYNGENASEINHDVLFREGLTHKGETTFTPRLLLADLKGSLKSLSEHGGDLYNKLAEPSAANVHWADASVEVIKEETVVKSEFQVALEHQTLAKINSDSLNSDVKVWSDFLYSRFHPRTVNIIKGFEHEHSDIPFDVYPLGETVWRSSDFCDGFTDKIRNYIEECDNPQGFHLTVDATNSFGGLATSCLEYLRDEYEKKSVLTFAAIPSWYPDYSFSNADERETSTKKDSIRLVNLALCLQGLGELSSLTIPICTGSKGWRQPGPKRIFNHVDYNPNLYYHTSAILASALDTLTMPYRLKSTKFSLNDFCADMSGFGRKIAAASVCLPFSLNEKTDLIDCLDTWDGPLWQAITPNCTIGSDKVMQIITGRGIPESRLKRPPPLAKKQREMAAYRCENVQEMIELYLSCNSYASASHVTTLAQPLSTRIPFPNIFDDFVDVYGDIRDFSRDNNQVVKSVPVIAGCHSCSQVGEMLESLHREASRIKIARFQQFKTAGLETDEYTEYLCKLLDIRECYEESFD